MSPDYRKRSEHLSIVEVSHRLTGHVSVLSMDRWEVTQASASARAQETWDIISTVMCVCVCGRGGSRTCTTAFRFEEADMKWDINGETFKPLVYLILLWEDAASEGSDTAPVPGIGVMRWRRGVPLWGERRAGERTEKKKRNTQNKKTFDSCYISFLSTETSIRLDIVTVGVKSCAHLSDSWEHRTPQAQRAWPCCQNEPTLLSVSASCGGYDHSDWLTYLWTTLFLYIYTSSMTSPYFSEKQQFFGPVQDRQERPH